MVKEVTRYIKREVERELWARSAGRCQFNGCNRILYYSPITLETVNISEKAHIYSFSEDGPRGWGPFVANIDKLNDIDNLMLMCHDCHKTIDQDKKGERYSGDLLHKWKKEHELRVYINSGIAPTNKTHVVFYGSNIGEQKSPIQKIETYEAIFPNRYPVDEDPIKLSMSCSHEDKTPEFWCTEQQHLRKAFIQKIEPKIEENNPAHFSVFALAPMPLLIQLGALFTDKISVDVYQPIREPKTWKWQDTPDNFEFQTIGAKNSLNQPTLILSLSANIDKSRIYDVLGEQVDIWEVIVPKAFQHNDFVKSPDQLSLFRSHLRKVIVNIGEKYGIKTPLHIFPAMPVSCAIELGRIRMPKADMPWIIYDQNNKENKFIKAIEIKEQ